MNRWESDIGPKETDLPIPLCGPQKSLKSPKGLIGGASGVAGNCRNMGDLTKHLTEFPLKLMKFGANPKRRKQSSWCIISLKLRFIQQC